jgi:DNA polymerase III epsilon subunit-like protein
VLNQGVKMQLNEEQQEVVNNYISKLIKRLKGNNKFIVYDLETNGFVQDPMPSVLSISAEKCKLNSDRTISIIDTYNRFYYCKEPYNPKATKVNGLTDNIVIKKRRGLLTKYPPYFLDDINSFKTFCDDSIIFMGYNNNAFDNVFIEDYMVFTHSLDIMLLQSNIEGGKYRKLKEVAVDPYNITMNEAELHQSSYDVMLTRSIFECILSLSSVKMIKLEE